MAAVFLALPGFETVNAQERANELALARLRPGKDTLATAKKVYGDERRAAQPDDENARTWKDTCKHTLRVEADEHGVIQFITVSEEERPSEKPHKDCVDKSNARPRSALWRTGKGLRLGDKCVRVVALYGAPNSGGPSTGGNRELELLFYGFDWAGSDVPQVMEVYCDRATARVVQITLAFPSL